MISPPAKFGLGKWFEISSGICWYHWQCQCQVTFCRASSQVTRSITTMDRARPRVWSVRTRRGAFLVWPGGRRFGVVGCCLRCRGNPRIMEAAQWMARWGHNRQTLIGFRAEIIGELSESGEPWIAGLTTCTEPTGNIYTIYNPMHSHLGLFTCLHACTQMHLHWLLANSSQCQGSALIIKLWARYCKSPATCVRLVIWNWRGIKNAARVSHFTVGFIMYQYMWCSKPTAPLSYWRL